MNNRIIDWEILFFDWMKSGLSRVEFLKANKIPVLSAITNYKTKNWEQRAKLKYGYSVPLNVSPPQNADDDDDDGPNQPITIEVGQKQIEPPSSPSGPETENRNPSPENSDPMTSPDPDADRDDELVNEGKQNGSTPASQMGLNPQEVWKLVSEWRRKQSESDYRLGDLIRLHCKVILKQSISVQTDEHGNRNYISSLKPSEISNIAKTSEIVQKVQRLALGMSQESIGVDNLIETSEEDIPVFEVQMSRNGKFIKLR